MNVFLATFIRAIMLGIGVLTGDKGWEDEELITMVIGVVLGIGALVWGLLEKKQLVKRGQSPSPGVRLRAKNEKDAPADDALLGKDPHERRKKFS
jgi:hypothetical protein